MPEFCSFLIFRPNEIDLIHAICAEAGWRSRDIEDPSTRYRFTENGRSQLAQASALLDFQLDEGQQYGRLLVLKGNEEEADNIVQLICAANLIIGECPIFCVTAIWSMLPERSKDDDHIRGTAGRTTEGLRAA